MGVVGLVSKEVSGSVSGAVSVSLSGRAIAGDSRLPADRVALPRAEDAGRELARRHKGRCVVAHHARVDRHVPVLVVKDVIVQHCVVAPFLLEEVAEHVQVRLVRIHAHEAAPTLVLKHTFLNHRVISPLKLRGRPYGEGTPIVLSGGIDPSDAVQFLFKDLRQEGALHDAARPEVVRIRLAGMVLVTHCRAEADLR